jgi:hypothetical protein
VIGRVIRNDVTTCVVGQQNLVCPTDSLPCCRASARRYNYSLCEMVSIKPDKFFIKTLSELFIDMVDTNIVYGAHAIALVAQADAKHIKDLFFLPFVKPLMDLDRRKRWINACIFDFWMLEKFCCLLPTRLPQVNYPFFNYSIR